MTEKDKIELTRFTILTLMYISSLDPNNIIAFIHGYELGREGKCKFTKLLRRHFEDKLSTTYSSDGWWGQIKRYSSKKNISWAKAFKQASLEIIASEENGGLDEEMQTLIKVRIVSLIERINYSWFNEDSIDELNSICMIKSDWFKNLWDNQSFKILKSIKNEINKNDVWDSEKLFKPTASLLKLKNKFERITNLKNLQQSV